MKAGECVHYTGCINPRKPACDAGVNYREHVGGDGMAQRFGLEPGSVEAAVIEWPHSAEAHARALLDDVADTL